MGKIHTQLLPSLSHQVQFQSLRELVDLGTRGQTSNAFAFNGEAAARCEPARPEAQKGIAGDAGSNEESTAWHRDKLSLLLALPNNFQMEATGPGRPLEE